MPRSDAGSKPTRARPGREQGERPDHASLLASPPLPWVERESFRERDANRRYFTILLRRNKRARGLLPPGVRCSRAIVGRALPLARIVSAKIRKQECLPYKSKPTRYGHSHQ